MKNILFLLSLLLICIISCGNGGTPEKSTGKESENENSIHETGDSDSNPTNSSDYDNNSENMENIGETSEENGQLDSDTDKNNETTPEESSDEDKTPENAAKYCVIGCKTASDCVPAGSNAITDGDNYNCDNGKCVYLGCLSDAECDEIYGAVTAATGRVYRCNKNGAYGYPECTPACSNAADCNLYGEGSTQYAYDLDNNKCESGFCVYTGCLSDAECETTMYSSDYKCLPQEYVGKTLNICTIPCKSAADCANETYPEEFYECKNSQCVTKNCENDEWCKNYIGENYSCR